MQKNKFVHEDIKAVCNSATKKMVAIGLIASTTVGSANFVGVSYKNISCAQTDGNQQLYDATLSYSYVECILYYLDRRPREVINRMIQNGQEMIEILRDDGIPEKLIDDYASCIQQVRSTGKVNSSFFIAMIAISRWRHEHGEYTWYNIEDTNTVALLPKCANVEEYYRKRVVEIDNKCNLADLATEVDRVGTRIVAGYRDLAERVRANGGCVDDAILNELIELRMMELDLDYQLEDALNSQE